MIRKIQFLIIYIFKYYFGFNTKSRILVLNYHGLVEQITNERLQRNFHTIPQFKKHIEILKKEKFIFLNADQFVFYHQNLIKKKRLVFLIFDDGYKNNLKAIEILKTQNIPCTFFLSTQSIDTKHSIWTVNLSLLLLEGNLNEIIYKKKYYSIKNSFEKSSFFNLVRNELKFCSLEHRTKVICDFINQYPENELERLFEKHNYFKMLTWNDIKKVQTNNIQFHSHGHSQEIHYENQCIELMTNEIELSKQIIEDNLKKSVYLFAFPNGNYFKTSESILEKYGYKNAFVLEGINNNLGKFRIQRIIPNSKIYKFKNQIL